MADTPDNSIPVLASARQTLEKHEDRFRLLVESVRDYAILMLDPTGIVATWNVGAERIKGYRANEIIGQHFERFYPADEIAADRPMRMLAAATADGRVEGEGWRVRKDGSRFWANVVITALRNENGELEGFAKVTRDLTERRIAESARIRLAQTDAAREEAEAAVKRLINLQALMGVLAGALTPGDLAKVIVAKGCEVLGAHAGGFIRAKKTERSSSSSSPNTNNINNVTMFETIAVAGVPSDVLTVFQSFSSELRVPVSLAYKTKQVQWVETEEDYRNRFPDLPTHLVVGASAAFPLIVGGEVSGIISFRFPKPRTFTIAERAFMETFATQAAQALDRADVYARELVSRRRLESLSNLASALSSALTTEDVARIVVESGMDGATADTCTLYAFNEETRALDLIAERGCNPEIIRDIVRITAESNHPSYASIRDGKSIWVETDEDYARFNPKLAQADIAGRRARSFWSVPLIAEGKPIGLLGMGFHTPRTFEDGEREFVETFTRQCAEALLRARRLEAEIKARTIAENLQASLATTLRSIGDAVITTDEKGLVTIMNPIAETLTGFSEADARGQPLTDIFRIINEHTREPVESPVAKVLELGAVVGLANHTVLVHRDGKHETPIDDSGAPIRGLDGEIDGVVLVFRDVTDKKREESRRSFLEQATTALAESLEYESTLAKIARLAVPMLADWCGVDVVVDGQQPQASTRLAVAHINPAKMTLARELAEKYPPNPNALTGVPNVLRTGQSELYPAITDEMIRAGAVDEEHLRLTLDLHLRSAMCVPLIARGRTLGAITFVWAESEHTYTKDDLAFAEELGRRCAVAIDNARLYAAEQLARQSADVANRAKDEFLATVSHELRTPLNAIMGWAKMLSSANLDAAKTARAIETIDRNAVAMAQLIEDLLDISRIISGKMRLDVQAVDLGLVIEAAIESVKPAADAKDIRMISLLDTGVGTRALTGDPTRLQQVVWNLLSNAVKFTTKGGRIDVVMQRENSGIEIRITDTGKGIARHFLPHVFDPFRQEDASHTRSRGGLGLGLAITKQLVELHGGRIEVFSEGEARGSTFVVHLPMIAVAANPPEKQTGQSRKIRVEASFERPEQLNGVRALVVDDEEDARLLVKAVLENCGCVVVVAPSVEVAMKELMNAPFDVLISDIGMPVQDGYDLIRQVRSLPSADGVSGIPAAALTAYARAEDRRRVLNAGYSMHIAKPVEPAELVAVVMSLTRFLQRQSPSSSSR